MVSVPGTGALRRLPRRCTLGIVLTAIAGCAARPPSPERAPVAAASPSSVPVAAAAWDGADREYWDAAEGLARVKDRRPLATPEWRAQYTDDGGGERSWRSGLRVNLLNPWQERRRRLGVAADLDALRQQRAAAAGDLVAQRLADRLALRQAIDEAELADQEAELAEQRLSFASQARAAGAAVTLEVLEAEQRARTARARREEAGQHRDRLAAACRERYGADAAGPWEPPPLEATPVAELQRAARAADPDLARLQALARAAGWRAAASRVPGFTWPGFVEVFYGDRIDRDDQQWGVEASLPLTFGQDDRSERQAERRLAAAEAARAALELDRRVAWAAQMAADAAAIAGAAATAATPSPEAARALAQPIELAKDGREQAERLIALRLADLQQRRQVLALTRAAREARLHLALLTGGGR